MRNILIIDDDVHIGNMLEETLSRAGYGVWRAYSGSEALLLLSRRRPDLMLLDLMLPGLSGEEVLSRLREKGEAIPAIVLSAKADVSEKVELLLGGAVDYVTKPFDTRELLARITVQLRRPSCSESPSPDIPAPVLTYGCLSLDTSSRCVTANDHEVRLTRTEYAILKLLMNNPSQVITKSLLLDRISGDTPDCTESSLKIHVSNLRRKLKAVTDKDLIEAAWGIGFKMREE